VQIVSGRSDRLISVNDIWKGSDMMTVLICVTAAAILIGAVYAIVGCRKKPEKEVSDIICANTNCGYKGKPCRQRQRSTLVFVFLSVLWLLPGIVYYLLVPEYSYWCPQCKAKVSV